MKVEVTKSFPWAPDGNNVREVKVGEVLEGRGASIALELKCGRAVEEKPAAPAPSAPAPVEEKAVAAAPENKATKPARNKAR